MDREDWRCNFFFSFLIIEMVALRDFYAFIGNVCSIWSFVVVLF